MADEFNHAYTPSIAAEVIFIIILVVLLSVHDVHLIRTEPWT